MGLHLSTCFNLIFTHLNFAQIHDNATFHIWCTWQPSQNNYHGLPIFVCHSLESEMSAFVVPTCVCGHDLHQQMGDKLWKLRNAHKGVVSPTSWWDGPAERSMPTEKRLMQQTPTPALRIPSYTSLIVSALFLHIVLDSLQSSDPKGGQDKAETSRYVSVGIQGGGFGLAIYPSIMHITSLREL